MEKIVALAQLIRQEMNNLMPSLIFLQEFPESRQAASNQEV